MKCQDVRRALSLFVDGELALTEWAIIQGHLLQCAECRKELERLRALAGVRARARQRRATATSAVAMAVVLAVAGGGVFIYQAASPTCRQGPPLPPRTATPTAPAPEPVAPVTGPGPVRAVLAPASRAGARGPPRRRPGGRRLPRPSRPRARRARRPTAEAPDRGADADHAGPPARGR